MSSANKEEHEELEQVMWRRFQEAEAVPGPAVWSKIDHALALQENEQYKKRLLFYRQLAAACFALFILAGTALVFLYKENSTPQLVATGKTGQSSTIASQPVHPAPDQAGSNLIEAASTPAASQPNIAANYSTTEEQTIAGNLERNYTPSGATQVTIEAPATLQQEERASQVAALAPEQVTERASLSESAVQGYLPAAHAIANVPENYTSAATMNPLLRRNALQGSAVAEETVAATIDQQQTALALALKKDETEQAASRTETRNNRWSIAMAYAPSYFTQSIGLPGQTITPPTVRTFGAQAEPSMSEESEKNLQDAREEFKENTRAAMSYNVDAKAGFRLGKRLKLLAGLGYSQNTSKTRTSYIVEQFLFKPRTNERHGLNPSTIFLPSLHTFTTDSVNVKKVAPFDVTYSYQMLSVPIGLQVDGGIGEKWFWYGSGSIAANFLMQTTINSSLPEIASVTYGVTDDSPFRKVQFSGNVGFGLGKQISESVSVSFGPEFRGFFNSLLTDDKAVATQGRPYTIGVNMGVSYLLGHSSK
ncbi:MAG TPA: hypothetical protein VIG72_14415 [Pontibacter sp.]